MASSGDSDGEAASKRARVDCPPAPTIREVTTHLVRGPNGNVLEMHHSITGKHVPREGIVWKTDANGRIREYCSRHDRRTDKCADCRLSASICGCGKRKDRCGCKKSEAVA